MRDVGGRPETIQQYLGQWFTWDESRLPIAIQVKVQVIWERHLLARRAYLEVLAELDDALVDAKGYIT